MSTNPPLHIEKTLYGGSGLAHRADGAAVLLPFTLAGELVTDPASSDHPTILQPSPDRIEPGCVHFGACGGCQYQMASYESQLRLKGGTLHDLLIRAGLTDIPEPQLHSSPSPWNYRNRIRLRARWLDGMFRLGYNQRASTDFLPIRMCPIAAPLLPRAADALMSLAHQTPALAPWFQATAEVELFCTADERSLQVQLLSHQSKPPQTARSASFDHLAEALHRHCPELAGLGLARTDRRSGQLRQTLAAWGAPGLTYPVDDETYWITRGGFFQINRFLLPTLVELVCGARSGRLAWDLFAGVGLFSRVLARRFHAITAVEANPIACADLRRTFSKLGPQHGALEATTLDFLRRAVLDRTRPDLVVLDPPRAGAGEEASALIAKLTPAEVVYVSCDPTTLARDLLVFCNAGYRIQTLHLIDLFPQTYHLETVTVLHRMGDGPPNALIGG